MGVDEAQGHAGRKQVEVIDDGEVELPWEGHEMYWRRHYCLVLWSFLLWLVVGMFLREIYCEAVSGLE